MLFVTAGESSTTCLPPLRHGDIKATLARDTHTDVLVVDEIGYLAYDIDAAHMLFHVVNDRHRRKRAMILTISKSLAAYRHVLHDEDLAHAIVDRILERGRAARISGIRRADSPEPTSGTRPVRRSRSAYRLASLAADLRIGAVVDVPHVLVAMHIPKSVLPSQQGR